MNAKNKLINVVMVAVMVIGLLSGCGAQSTNTPQSTNTGSSAEKPTELVVAVPSFMAVPKNWQAVQDEVSKITLEKLNATVKVNLINMGEYGQQFNLMMAGGQAIDILYVGTMPTNMFAAPAISGQFMPLNKLLDQYGQGIKKAIDPAYLKAGQINGNQYAIPLLENWATQNGFTMRQDMVDKYQIDLSKIKLPQDMDAVFQTIKAKEPNLTPLAANKIGTVLQQLRWYDQMGDSLGVLPNWDNNLKLVNVYETPEYAQMCELVSNWFKKGYIQADAVTSQQNSMDVVKAGQAFAMPGGAAPGWEATLERIMGIKMVAVPMNQPVVTTFDVSRDMYAIPHSSKNPDKAMQLLDLLYTDKDIVNLIDNGIEGKDYVKKSDHVIDYPPGVSPQDRYPGIGGQGIGNSFLSYVYSTGDPNIHQKSAEFTKQALKSKALGFQFDASAVKTEYTAIMNVVSQYVPGLENGSLDPAKTLPVFNAKLKAAGLDKIIAEKQKQLDQWAKTNQ